MRFLSVHWAAPCAVVCAVGLGLVIRAGGRHPANKVTSRGMPREMDDVKDDEALKAYEWRSKAWKDAHGEIPPDGLVRAMDQRAAMVSQASHSKLNTQLQWTNLGPLGISGRGRSILFDPTNPNVILEGSVGGGIWKSADAGKTFSPVNDLMSDLAIGCMTRDPENPAIVYAGTGEGMLNIDSLQGKGVFKSVDYGNTWTQQVGTANIGWINRISVSPSNSSIVLLAGAQAMWGPGGVYRSTNGGQSFTNVLGDPNMTGTQVIFNPQDSTKAVAVAWTYNSSLGNDAYTAYYSTNGGVTWTASTGPLNAVPGFGSRLELAYAPSNPSIVYSTNASDGNIYKSTDGGQTYSEVTTSGQLDLSSQGWYDNCIWVSPLDPDLVVAAGITVWKSTDGGATLTHIGDGYNGTGLQPHADTHALVSDPWFNGTTDCALYVYTDGGTFMTNNVFTVQSNPSSGLSGWQVLDSAVTTQFYSVAGDGPSRLVIGGTQDNGTEQVTNSGEGSWIFGGDGGFVAMDPTNPLYEYGEYVYLQIFRSTDGTGNTSNWIDGGLTDAGGNANFIAPFVLDPNDPNKLWAGGGHLWLSTNVKAATPTWTMVRPQDSGSDPLLSAIAVAPGNSNIVWIGENDGTVSMSTNALAASPTWTTVNNTVAGSPQFNRMITRIFIDPANSNLVYVCMGGFTSNNIWKTTDGGNTWTSITGSGLTGLPQAPVRGFTRDPLDPRSLFVGTEVGVFWSLDGGQTWSTSNIAPANVSVDEITFENNAHVLIAGTHGRGLWSATFAPLSFGFSASQIYSSGATTGTVMLTYPAPAGGLVVSLKCSNTAALRVPSSVTIPAGSNTATFVATAPLVSAATSATVTASSANLSVSNTVTVLPGGLTRFVVSPGTAIGGSTTVVTGTVTLDGPAPSGGAVVNVSSSDGSAKVPATVTVPAGLLTTSFQITPLSVAKTDVVTLTAQRGTAAYTEPLTVTPPIPAAVAFSPTSVVGGVSSIGTVTLDAVAPSGGLSVSLSSAAGAVAVPSRVTVPAGAKTATFTATTFPVAVSTSVAVSGTLGSTVKGTLTVTPGVPKALTFSPTIVEGGTSTVGTVTMSGAAPPGGLVVALTSSIASAVPPASVTVTAGTTSATFTVATQAVSANVTPIIYAKYAGEGVDTSFSIKAPVMASVSVSPTSVQGSSATKVTLTVNIGSPAGPSGCVVTLTSSNAAAKVPATVTIPANATAASVTVTHTTVAATTAVKLTGTTNGTSGTATLTLTH